MSQISLLLVLSVLFWNFPINDTAIETRLVRICTAGNEDHDKCRAMQNITDGEGINPSIECVQLTSKSRDALQCLDEVFLGDNSTTPTDVTFISSDEIYTAKKSNMTLIQLSNKWVKTVLLVNSSIVKNLSDLKGGRACFSKAMDASYLSVAYILNDKIYSNNTCMFDVKLTEYIGPACTPDFQDDYIKTSVKIEDPFEGEGPCTLCHRYDSQSPTDRQCNYNTTVNLYAGREGALECLSYTGHFAAITLGGNISLPNGMKVMCKNGTLSDTLDVDENCYLMEMPAEAIVIRRDHPQLKAIHETLVRVMDASWTVRGEFIQIPIGGAVNNERQRQFMEFFDSIDKCPRPPIELPESRFGEIAIIIAVVILVVAVVFGLGYYVRRRYLIRATPRNAIRKISDSGPEKVALTDQVNAHESDTN